MEERASGAARRSLAACAPGWAARTGVYVRPLESERSMVLSPGFVLIGLFIGKARNLGPFRGLSPYPNRLGARSAVHVGKRSTWSLPIALRFRSVAHLKHVKAGIHLSP
ncbi:DUF817 family protein [Massilia sp. 9096]|uniref:DUF817 family protein n=1 Tax=Massilia sp. 9096 TaxID=1500894 RepID=UPI0035A5967F